MGKIFGIRIVAEEPSGNLRKFRMFTGEFRKGDLFATNPVVRRMLEAGKLELGRQVGFVDVLVHPSDKTIITKRFSPSVLGWAMHRAASKRKG